jgi:outer membrane protein TolC
MDQRAAFTKEKVVELALAQRPELALAAAGVDVFRLEVYAQGRIPFRRVVPTFAAGADIHSKDIPQAVRTKEYRPGSIAPEMPTQLVGSKFDRVCRAMNFSEKADAIYENARSLVKLDAENAFYEYELASQKLRIAERKFKDGKDLQQRTRDMSDSVKEKDLLVQAYIVSIKAQSDYVEAVYQHLLSLAALERITAGGICPKFPGR